MTDRMSEPIDDLEPPCERTRFFEALLDDDERGRLRPVDAYVAAFPAIADFVRTEYDAWTRQGNTPPDAAAGEASAMPATIGRFRVLRRIGQGGMGQVFEAEDPQVRRRVVIKSVQPALARDAGAVARLRREARVLGSLDHRSLVKVIDVLEEGGAVHLVMPFHDGETMAAHLAAARAASDAGAPFVRLGGATDRGEALRALLTWFFAVAQALDHAHRAGVVHRDVKPENLLVLSSGGAMVLDFGLAQPGDEVRLTAIGEVVGTPLYMAPEQIEGQAPTAATDVYALGVVLYEVLTLVHPFAGPGGRAGAFQRILLGDPVSPRRHDPRLSRDLEAVVLRAMERSPQRRYADAGALARDLKRVLDLEPTEARPVSAVTAVWRKARRRPRAAATLAVAFFAAAAATYAFVEVRRLRANQDAARAALETLQAQPGAAAVADELSRVVERMRSAAIAPGPGLHAIHPRGAVPVGDGIAWIGLPARDDDLLPGVVCVHRYRVEVRGADGAVAAAFEVDADPATRWCEAAWPAGAPSRGRWRAQWIGARLPDATFAAASAEERAAFAVEAAFAIDAVASTGATAPSSALRAALRPGAAGTAAERVRAGVDAARALGDDELAALLAAELRGIEGR